MIKGGGDEQEVEKEEEEVKESISMRQRRIMRISYNIVK